MEYTGKGDFVSASTQFACLLGFGTMSVAQWFLCDKAETCVQFLNGMLDLETEFLNRESEMKIPKLLCKMLVHIEAVAPIFTGIGSGLMPCSPPNMIVFFNPSCNYPQNMLNSPKSLPGKCLEFIILATMNGIFWKAATGCGTTWAFHILVGCKSQWMALKSIKRNPELNRRIQLLNTIFNEAYVGTIFASLAGCSFALTMVSYTLFVVTTSSLDFPFLVKVWLILMMFDGTVVMIYVCKLAASVFSMSKNVLMKQNSTLSATRMYRLKKRILRSCPPIKVSFGLCNFIDNETPLKLLQFSVDRFVDLVLTT
ncbi:unnamed protein product [Orchesella dallaii]|uniref:Gustatory receptor n=1 Tax=Orchesella dallaii TaxID=48710 RepID=A0ABP1RD43_9HEXA